MASLRSMYNSLPTLGEAEVRFTDRAGMMTKLAPLLAAYGGMFGLCLIHAHCSLAEGEVMLADGHVSQPVKRSEILGPCYPDRWLPTGEPYEFTTRTTTEPPAELLLSFARLTGAIGVLGLYYVGPDDPEPVLEWNQDRCIPHTETAWNPTKDNPVAMACMMVCDSRETRTSTKHKDTKSHLDIPDVA
ncbi:MAG: hypothetical protein M1826_004486 [Phylliscum demangeonii]|nr:MAG: hypothetical protein M1826_004486 [Phylliscum demangeonii]